MATGGRRKGVGSPSRSESRRPGFTRAEIAKLVRAAYRSKRTRWLARFMLVACYMCTRTQTILDMSFMQQEGRSYIDLEQGTFLRVVIEPRKYWYRAPYRDPCPMLVPRPLLEHMRQARGASSRRSPPKSDTGGSRI
jgi:hypothetical protein